MRNLSCRHWLSFLMDMSWSWKSAAQSSAALPRVLVPLPPQTESVITLE